MGEGGICHLPPSFKFSCKPNANLYLSIYSLTYFLANCFISSFISSLCSLLMCFNTHSLNAFVSSHFLLLYCLSPSIFLFGFFTLLTVCLLLYSVHLYIAFLYYFFCLLLELLIDLYTLFKLPPIACVWYSKAQS